MRFSQLYRQKNITMFYETKTENAAYIIRCPDSPFHEHMSLTVGVGKCCCWTVLDIHLPCTCQLYWISQSCHTPKLVRKVTFQFRTFPMAFSLHQTMWVRYIDIVCNIRNIGRCLAVCECDSGSVSLPGLCVSPRGAVLSARPNGVYNYSV